MKSNLCKFIFIVIVSCSIMQGCAGTIKETEDVLDQSGAGRSVEPKNRYEASTGVSFLKIEMRVLNEAYKNLIECLVLKMPEGIEDPFQELKKAKIKTDEALKKGEVKLPVANEKIKKFEEMHRQFYTKIDAVIEASRNKEMKTLRDLTQQLLNSCIQCHYRFRSQ